MAFTEYKGATLSPHRHIRTCRVLETDVLKLDSSSWSRQFLACAIVGVDQWFLKNANVQGRQFSVLWVLGARGQNESGAPYDPKSERVGRKFAYAN
jgi:hypothetical protein